MKVKKKKMCKDPRGCGYSVIVASIGCKLWEPPVWSTPAGLVLEESLKASLPTWITTCMEYNSVLETGTK